MSSEIRILDRMQMKNKLMLFWFSIIFLSFHLPSIVSVTCPEEQRSLLMKLKEEFSMNSSIESKLSSWSPETDCCFWDGITCDSETGNVIGLDLSGCSISVGINSSISLFNLQHLQRLNLANNYFPSMTIPSGFGNLSQLTHLNLSYSGFAGQVPLDISYMRNLISLDLSCLYASSILKLQDPDLATLLNNLTNLQELVLDGVNISMSGHEWCQILGEKVPHLRVLSLSDCNLFGPIHYSLLQLQHLAHLNLDHNELSSVFPDFLTSFSYLTSLHLSGCNLHGWFPETIFLMATLQIIDVSNNPLLKGNLPEFPQAKSIQVIHLSSTKFSGKLPESMDNLASLRELDLFECDFFGSVPSSFDNFTDLVYLDLSTNNFSGSIPRLTSSRKISHVDLSHNGFTGTIPSSFGNGLVYLKVLELQNNSLHGMIPSSLFVLPSIERLSLGRNKLTGQLKEFENASYSLLKVIDLSKNQLKGPVPLSFFEIRGLARLELYSNFFNGTVEAGMFEGLKNLTTLDLSDNKFSFITSRSDVSILAQIATFRMGSCNITQFPVFLKNSRYLFHIDLSNNRITGEIPNWIWKVSNLAHLNLSHNMLHGFEKPVPDLSLSNSLSVLDLHSNMLHQPFLTPPRGIVYLDYSNNSFTSTIPLNIGDLLIFAIFISFSSNGLSGELPLSLCRMSYVQILDVSDNHFNGSIPSCLASVDSLQVLKLRNNSFQGVMPRKFSEECRLRTLDLSQNYLVGVLPRSLENCKSLEVLDLGTNKLDGSFPSWLETLPTLRVLVLRSNNFSGLIRQSHTDKAFQMLQIIDLSSNNFRGTLPSEWFRSWEAMMKQKKESQSSQVIKFTFMELSGLYYQDSVILTSKGLDMNFVKILTIFTSISLSDNQFKGDIPESFGNLVSLISLNLSKNHFTGLIPPTLMNLTELESLDLSQNKLSGKIPAGLSTLTFLSVFNVSENSLAGEIPRGPQFNTFSAASFEGNTELCGPPLPKDCQKKLPTENTKQSSRTPSSKWGIDWEFFWIGFGFGEGAGTVLGVIAGIFVTNMFWSNRIRRFSHRSIRPL